jgi:hypothetical protein
VSPSHPAIQANVEQCAQPNDEATWVVYEYCISIIAVTWRRPSQPVRLRPDKRSWVHGLPYCLISLLFGWWGLPWGLIYTPLTIYSNLCGGCRITVPDRGGHPATM